MVGYILHPDLLQEELKNGIQKNGGETNEIDDFNAFDIKYTVTDPFGAIETKTVDGGKERGKERFNLYSGINADGGPPQTPKPTPPTPAPPPPPPSPAPAGCINAVGDVLPIIYLVGASGAHKEQCGKYDGTGEKCCPKSGAPKPSPNPTPKPTPKHDASGHDYVPTPSPKPPSGKCEIGKMMPDGWEFHSCGLLP